MSGRIGTVVTTPVPVYGFGESVLGIDRCTTSLNRITQAIQASCKVTTENTPFAVVTYRKRRGHYYVRRAQASAIEYLTFPLRSEPGRPTTTVDTQQSGKPDYYPGKKVSHP
jgi:hypothetical protein